MIDGLRGAPAGPLDGVTVLDIGAGVGAVHLELIQAGAASAVDIDGSPAYVSAAREEAERRGVADRVTHLAGDFVERAADVPPADLVALDRVVCCYPDLTALVTAATARARRRIGFVYPRDRWWIRFGSGFMNALLRGFRRRLRFHVHRTADLEAIVRADGLVASFRRSGIFWQVVVFERR